jgi:hypothetical protein
MNKLLGIQSDKISQQIALNILGLHIDFRHSVHGMTSSRFMYKHYRIGFNAGKKDQARLYNRA